MSKSAQRFGSQSRLRNGFRASASAFKATEINAGMGASDDGDVGREETDQQHIGDQEHYAE